MKWKKLGLVFKPDANIWWSKSHAMIPTPVLLNDRLIVYFSACDENGVARIGFLELNKSNPLEVIYRSNSPLMDIGIPGTFDENGTAVCSVVHYKGQLFLYYVGFELGTKIRYRLFTGLAEGKAIDDYRRHSSVPILDRSDDELFFRCGPFVIRENNKFKMWYIAGSEWELIEGKQMPLYTIKYSESEDGINWPKQGEVCLEIKRKTEHGFGRPYVLKLNSIYYMFFSIRKKSLGYRIGYATSIDGLTWERKNDVGIEVSSESSDFDSDMICYSSIFELNNEIYMLYNGNGFGETGFGLAELVSLG